MSPKPKETKESILNSEVTSPEAKPPKAAKKIYYFAIAALVIITFLAGWFALKAIFPKLAIAPTTPTKREIIPSESPPSAQIQEEKPIKTFEDVDEALDELDSRVGELDKIDSDLETPDINLDDIAF